MTLATLPLVWWLLPESVQLLASRRRPNSLARINQILRQLGHRPLADLPALAVEPPPARVRSLLEGEYREATLRLWCSFFLCFGTLYFLLSWIPKLLVDAGMPLEQAIYAGIAFNIGGVGGNLLIGWVSGRFGLQRTILVFNLLAAAGMLVFASAPLSVGGLLLLTAFIGLFQQGGFVGLYMVAARIYPAEIRTTGVGWGIGLGRFGAVIAPYGAGLLIGAGWSGSLLFVLFSVPLIIGGVVVLTVRSRELGIVHQA